MATFKDKVRFYPQEPWRECMDILLKPSLERNGQQQSLTQQKASWESRNEVTTVGWNQENEWPVAIGENWEMLMEGEKCGEEKIIFPLPF